MSTFTVPRELVSPLDIRYVRDDLHVMAFLESHPEYESVEAMIRFRDSGPPTVRAILTRHDQSQVDHINDPQLLRSAATSGRQSVEREIEASLDLSARLPSAEVRFKSLSGEKVLLRVVCASPPDPKRGGISDPGSHSLTSSLPIMCRGKSAMASPQSRVEIADKPYAIPEKLRAGPQFVAHNGYFTVGHSMAILRAGRRHVALLRQPTSLQLGECWIYESREGRKTYTIASISDSGQMTISSPEGELILASHSGQRLALREIQVGIAPHAPSGVRLKFESSGLFSIAVDHCSDAISGSFTQPTDNEIVLSPSGPEWAVRRIFAAHWRSAESGLSIESTVAEGADEA